MPKSNFVKEKILKILRKPIKVTDLKNAIPEITSFGTINYWLKKLESEGVIKKKKFKNLQGKPTFYALKNVSLKKDEKELLKEFKRLDRLENIRFLKYIESNPGIELNEVKEGVLYGDAKTNALNEGLYTMKLYLTKKGKKFLEENKIE